VLPAWRAFPWDPAARPGAPFSPQYVHPLQGSGRFDLAEGGRGPLVLYVGESPAHAVGEVMQAFRGRTVGDAHLRRHGHPLALVDVRLGAGRAGMAIADLTRPAVLDRLGLRPDVLASHDRRRTRGAARAVHAAGYGGLRWWSALTGEWHGVVLFLDRVGTAALEYGAPEPVSTSSLALREAARLLGIRVR
jgi:hypothetical protein